LLTVISKSSDENLHQRCPIQMILPLLFLFATPITAAFRTQSAGVRGTLLCGDKPLVGAKVKLWDDDSGPDMDDLLQEGVTDAHGYFELSGHTSELSTIDPVLKIYHDCDDGIMPCQRKVAFEIPDSYVNNGEKAAKFFDIGTINMQIIFERETRDCLSRT
uniref:Transthyretin-like protein 5 n=1 Tax=Parascaris univalens TaxID=6257 RepID=A0A915CJY4_PARUN